MSRLQRHWHQLGRGSGMRSLQGERSWVLSATHELKDHTRPRINKQRVIIDCQLTGLGPGRPRCLEETGATGHPQGCVHPQPAVPSLAPGRERREGAKCPGKDQLSLQTRGASMECGAWAGREVNASFQRSSELWDSFNSPSPGGTGRLGLTTCVMNLVASISRALF